jgi:photosystem I subunit 9
MFWYNLKKQGKRETFQMKDFTTYLSTAPVLTLVSLTVVAGLLIEINRFFPDALIAAF